MPTRHFSCAIPECPQPALREFGGCDICNQHLCARHHSSNDHRCRTEILSSAAWTAQRVAEIHDIQARINDEAVCKLASSLNEGRRCTIEHWSKAGAGAMMGAANYHARIRFEDGSPSWLLRVPRGTSREVGFPEPLADHLTASEYATLKFLEGTRVPAPRVFAYGIRNRGPHADVGSNFLLMEELPGAVWYGQGSKTAKATEEDRAKIWNGLTRHPFPKAGSLSLSPSSGDVEVSAVASDCFLVLDPAGPFETSREYYTAWAEQYLELIADRQLYPDYPVEAYLVYEFLKDNVEQLLSPEDEKSTEGQNFYLKHVDDKGDHFMVDEELNIVGVIDWQMTRIVPAREAFGPSLVTVDLLALCGGRVSLSAKDRVLSDIWRTKAPPHLAHYMQDENERVRRFFWGLALEPNWSDAQPLAEGILRAFGVTKEWSQWRKERLESGAKDTRLQRLLEQIQDVDKVPGDASSSSSLGTVIANGP